MELDEPTSEFLKDIFARAKENPKRVVLQEGDDERVIEAGLKARETGIAKITFIGEKNKIEEVAKKLDTHLNDITIIDKNNLPKLDEYTEEYYNLRKHKGITKEQARNIIKNPLFYGAMMVRKGEVDTFVAGAINTTADVCRAAIQIVGLEEGVKTLSSFFIMLLPDKNFGKKGVLFYADCGVVIEPTEEQLADIAIETAECYRMLMGSEPKIAMLSFSTKGSAKHKFVDKIKNATQIAKEKVPSLIIDGELQADAALIPSVAERKVKDSSVAGHADILIFPDLNAGNIAYKITERLAKAEAFGPILQGTEKPVSDLSRGCKVTDVLNVIAINVVRYQYLEKYGHS